MSHKTLVNGTVYEVGGGKTLIDGVAYSIDKGKTLVGGTAYEVGFGPKMATVAITGYSNGYTVVAIDGVEYKPFSVIEVPIGTEVICTVIDYNYSGRPYITLNGETVSTDTYTYIVAGDVIIERTDDYVSGGGSKEPYGVIHITEIPEDHVLLTIKGYGGSVTIGGEFYSNTAVFVAPGTVVTIDNTGWKYDETESYIRVNGTTVLSGCGSYNYVATSNATITGSQTSTGNGTYYYCIDVTEQ